MHNLWASYNSNVPEPNFTKPGCEGSLDIVVIPVVVVFPEFFLVSAQRQTEDGGVWIFAAKMDAWMFWGTNFFVGGNVPDFHGVPPLTNNTTKTSFGENPSRRGWAVASKKTERPLKYIRRCLRLRRAAPSKYIGV